MEGPSLVILKQEMKPFVGKPIVEASGNAKNLGDEGPEQFIGKKIRWIKTWGKHYLMRIGEVTIKTHFLLWGSYTINKQKDRSPTLHLQFENGEVNFYSSSIRIFEGKLEDVYDWRVDVMSRKWDAEYVKKLVKEKPSAMVTDILLDQNIFAGVGNIIKNEVLFITKLHPEMKVRDLTPRQLTLLVQEAHKYSHQFYRWKKKYVLRKHWRIYKKGTCADCEGKLTIGHMGKGERYTYYCPACQPKSRKSGSLQTPKKRRARAL